MKGNELTRWDCHWFRMAQEVATMSKDPSTQVGAVIVDKHKRMIGSGYNGFPRGVADTQERLQKREIKYELVVHAEVNAILNSITEPRGCTMYCLAFPCPRCAAVIIQAGITKVYAGLNKDYETRWAAEIALSKEILYEADIDFVHLDEYDRPFMHPSHYLQRILT